MFVFFDLHLRFVFSVYNWVIICILLVFFLVTAHGVRLFVEFVRLPSVLNVFECEYKRDVCVPNIRFSVLVYFVYVCCWFIWIVVWFIYAFLLEWFLTGFLDFIYLCTYVICLLWYTYFHFYINGFLFCSLVRCVFKFV